MSLKTRADQPNPSSLPTRPYAFPLSYDGNQNPKPKRQCFMHDTPAHAIQGPAARHSHEHGRARYVTNTFLSSSVEYTSPVTRSLTWPAGRPDLTAYSSRRALP